MYARQIPFTFAACALVAGCGRTQIDVFVPDLPPRRCEGLLWAANSDGDLYLVDTETAAEERFATLPVGTWAMGTHESDGVLLLWEAVASNPRLWSYDPWTGASSRLDQLDTEDNMDRGGFGPDGLFWAVGVPSQTLRVHARGTGLTETRTLPDVGAGAGGDLAALDESIAIAWWPDGIGVIGSAATAPTPLLTSGSLGLGDLQLSGIAVTGGRVWISTVEGQFFDVGSPTDIVSAEAQGNFEIDAAVNDLAPVISRGPCPRP